MSTLHIPTNASFESALSGLNSGQKRAVETIDGPVMVIAGPGTGKTQILTLRIANILAKTDTRPEQILALTFTESGVRAMRERLLGFIGAEAYHVPIHTFHSFAGDLIRRYPDAYSSIVGGRPASDIEKINIIETILEDVSFKRVRPHGDPKFYVKPILQAISTLKKEYISADKFALSIKKQSEALLDIPKIHEKGAHKGKVRGEYQDAEKSLEKNQELLSIYRLYTSALKEARLYDFEDMVLDTIAALEDNEEMLLDVQEQYLYILADEHQDVNQSQNRLIELVASYHSRPNVFVVGDEKQAIYRFQGASLDNFLFFSDCYPDVVTIDLTDNYRSAQVILDVAHECIKTDDEALKRLRVPLVSKQNFEAKLSQANFKHTAVEESYIAKIVKDEIASGTKPSEIAVIVRTNREVELFTTLLRKEGVSVSPSADTDILTHPIFGQVINLLTFITRPEDEIGLVKMLLSPYTGVLSNDAAVLLHKRSRLEPLAKIISNKETLLEMGVSQPEPILKLHELANRTREFAVTKSPAEALEFLLHESGFINFVMEHDPLSGEAVLRRIYDEVEGMCIRREVDSLLSVLKQFLLLVDYGLPLSAPILSSHSEATRVMTAHKAKGLEFEVVLIPHLTDNVWGGSRGRADLFDLPVRRHDVLDEKLLTEDDERRLFYVAITRAKRSLIITYSDTNIEGREFIPSRFLANLVDRFVSVDTTEFTDKFSPLQSILPAKSVTFDGALLRETLAERGWSATSFNNYVASPFEYIFKNVLRFPTVKSPELQFGTAVHYVLERIVRTITQTGVRPADPEIISWLELALSKNVLSDAEYSRLRGRGVEAVFGYLKTLETASKSVARSKTEYQLTATLETGISDFKEVILTGNFDRVDFNHDGEVVGVVDYKTGKPKTRGEIEGTTKTSDGNYKRQLVFYALLLSLQSDNKLATNNMTLSFVEPDTKGNIKEETFLITEAEIEELKESIRKATREVVSGECLGFECDSSKSDFCELAKIWQI